MSTVAGSTVEAAGAVAAASAAASAAKQSYERIGVSEADTDEEVLRKAEPFLKSRAQSACVFARES